ncbi:MAG: hypothetical protein H3C43_04625 [Leptonema sp. (in: Bacteria)]|nr:hypothetical protein [Leptonema sp. (in: bacteria)]
MKPIIDLPPVVFLLGKGGVGRSTAAATLGLYYATGRNEKVLLVQWSIQDSISPFFDQPQCGHKHQQLLPNLSVMNYNADEAMKEYFVEHLNMGIFYKFILENQQVKKLIHAAPGLEELFFLGRLFWLVELAEKERGYKFDRIIIDSPATGHGSALFGVAATISKFKLSGPLVSETARVARLLEDQTKVGTAIVTLPEELPVEETLEMIPKITNDMGRPPLMILLNRSLSPLLKNGLLTEPTLSAKFTDKIESTLTKEDQLTSQAIAADLSRRITFEKQLRTTIANDIPVISIPDLMIPMPKAKKIAQIEMIAHQYLTNELSN